MKRMFKKRLADISVGDSLVFIGYLYVICIALYAAVWVIICHLNTICNFIEKIKAKFTKKKTWVETEEEDWA